MFPVLVPARGPLGPAGGALPPLYQRHGQSAGTWAEPTPTFTRVRVDPGTILHVPSGALGLRLVRKESKRNLLSPMPGSKVQNAVDSFC